MRYVVFAINVSREIERLIVEHVYVIAGTRIYGASTLGNKWQFFASSIGRSDSSRLCSLFAK
ncbi:MAG TPA: hypothetical protein V6C81_19970 [Planktothrix sp.]